MTHSLVSGNTSTNPSGGGDSGGIQNFGPNPVTGTAGTLAVDNSTMPATAPLRLASRPPPVVLRAPPSLKAIVEFVICVVLVAPDEEQALLVPRTS